MSNTNLRLIIEKIKNNELVLPDFQREYVWIKDEDKIREFIASVLALLPLGNIITFKDNCSSFANKEIGFNKAVSFSSQDEEVMFLLDGQQRITTLVLVFSNYIFDKVYKDRVYKEDLLLQKERIKKRFYLRIHKEDKAETDIDVFGYNDLILPFRQKVEFCSNEIIDLIECHSLTSEDILAMNISPGESPVNLDPLKNYLNQGLLPLYLVTDDICLREALESLAIDRAKTLGDSLKRQGIDYTISYFKSFNINIEKYDDRTQFDKQVDSFIKRNKECWVNDMCKYLSNCIEKLSLIELDVSGENTARAINMYEALNRGGAQLSTYDLIIARAANKACDYAKNNKLILEKYYNEELLKYIAKGTNIACWNSKEYMKTVDKNKDIAPVVISQFLNLLCFVANNANKNDLKMPNMELCSKSNDFCKAKQQLKLSADDITKFSETVMKSICDALMVLQFKCGIRSVKCVDYNLILLPLAYSMYLYETKSFINVDKLVDAFCGYYLLWIFTGEYQYDQSKRVVDHLNEIHNYLMCNKLRLDEARLNKILNIPNYNDLNILLYKNSDNPKKGVVNSILNYVLSKKPRDIIADKNGNFSRLTAWNLDLKLDAHHIIPLASAKNLRESTEQIRKQHIMINSPLNLVYISKDANLAISYRKPQDYLNDLSQDFESDYYIGTNDFRNLSKYNDDNIQLDKILSTRRSFLITQIKNDIENYLN